MAKLNPLLNMFNKGLQEMRELFHEVGRLEDSNSKLDEITKLLCLEIVAVRDSDINVPSLINIIDSHMFDSGLVMSLNRNLVLAAKSKLLTNYDGESLLGADPRFNIAESEELLAKGLAQIVHSSFHGFLEGSHGSDSFEFLNEAFSHFIRDNFRQNIEDAQYLTPPEVVNFMVELGIQRIKENSSHTTKPPIVCDPSCGVGSFLAQFYRVWSSAEQVKSQPILVGQDKVDRMARLCVLNLALFGIDNAIISRGNSLKKGSPLDTYAGKCDLILTNPPFGAKFSCSDLALNSTGFFPFLQEQINAGRNSLDSELLFLDYYFNLLKPNGTLLAVLPDSVISSAGLASDLRSSIHANYRIKSITELPAVTFAQAGTRTKTCILEVTKSGPINSKVHISKAVNLGFEVSSRKGVPYKRSVGENDLLKILNVALSTKESTVNEEMKVLSLSPSCVEVNQNRLAEEVWTPSHFSSSRLNTLLLINKLAEGVDYDVFELASLVSIVPKSKVRSQGETPVKCISVLHVSNFGALNVKEMSGYSPKITGRPCEVGDLLFSKINPRIPRALVVPELPYSLTCSNEFEVMRPKLEYCAHEIMLLLLSKYAQNQILSLTSGTSSSHNRIKTKQLLSVKLAVPKKGSVLRKKYERAVNTFREANISLNNANNALFNAWLSMNE